MFTSLAVNHDRQKRPGDVQHIAEILPLVLAKYAAHETQPIPRSECRASNIMPSPCVSA